MKQTSKMAMLAVALLAGVSGTAWANGTEIPPPEPSPYTPPPAPVEAPAPLPAAKVDNSGFYISGAVGLGMPGSFKTDYSHAQKVNNECTPGEKPNDGGKDGTCGIPKDRKCDSDKKSGGDAIPPTCTSETVDYIDTANGADFDLKSGLVLNGAIGYNFGSVRLEGAVGYQKHDFKDSEDDLSLLTAMVNGYYDFDTDSSVRPYIMGGLGMARVDMSWTSQNEDVFAWQVGAGLGLKVADSTTLDLGYRYLKPNEFDTHGLGDGKLECHNIMLGLRYQF